MKSIEEVRTAVDAGKLVNWASDLYVVEKWLVPSGYYVRCTTNDFSTGLCHGDVKDCYVSEPGI